MNIKYKNTIYQFLQIGDYGIYKICYKDIERVVYNEQIIGLEMRLTNNEGCLDISSKYLENLLDEMIEEYRNEQIKKILRNEDY